MIYYCDMGKIANTFGLLTLAFICSSARAATYYADSVSGDDSRDGLSETTAWRSLDKVNAADLKPGDTMLFKRGSLWRGQLDSKCGEPGKPVLYTAYGTGPKPCFLGSVSRSKTSDWIDAGDGIWFTKCGRPAVPGAKFEGEGKGKRILTEAGTAIPADLEYCALDIGIFICDHGKRWGYKKWSREQLVNELDYWYDITNDQVFVKLPKNPALL